MDVSSFKRDIDELIEEFAQGESTTLADMKQVWLSKKFSYIFEASPSTNQAFFMQSLYADTIGYMISAAPLLYRLGGLYCLYCLYETQPFKPPFRVYLSLGELRKLRDLVVRAKEKDIKVVSALVKRMLEKKMFLFGAVDLIEGSVAKTVNQLTELQNARIQVACEKLFTSTEIKKLLQMDLEIEVDLNALKKMSTEYAEAKGSAIEEASRVIDVQNVKDISTDMEFIDGVDEIANDWTVQNQSFYNQMRLKERLPLEQQQQLVQQQEQAIQGFDQELEQLLLKK